MTRWAETRSEVFPGGPGGRRAVLPEIRAAIREATGATPFNGFGKMLDPGDAMINTERRSGFSEMQDRREWLLSLSAGRGMTWETEPIERVSTDHVLLVFNLGFGNGNPLPQPTGAWQVSVNGKDAIRIRDVNHSERWRNDACTFAFAANRIETAPDHGALFLSTVVREESWAAFGPAILAVPTSWLDMGHAARICVQPIADAPSTRWIQIAPCLNMMQTTDIWAAVDVFSGRDRFRSDGLQPFFGDIHTHSGQVMDACDNEGCGRGSRIENYDYALGPGALDFYALTDHEWQIDPDRCGEYLDLADAYSVDGSFVCLPGFEHTSLLYGHRNVYFRGAGGTVFNATRGWGRPSLEPARSHAPAELWRAMEATGVPFITVPHHASATSHPLNLDLYHPQHDRLFEVYSSWGSSEYYGDSPRGMSDRLRFGDFQDAMRRGRRYGVIASSDGHDAHPGAAQSPWMKHHHIFHFQGSGRAAVWVPELTRETVFDALYDRRCYATTGPPIVLDVRCGDRVMGSELEPLRSGSVPQLSIQCEGSNGLDHVRIVKNGRIVHTVPLHGQHHARVEWEDRHYTTEEPSSYYVRIVQVDRESAWSSPIWIG